MRVYDVAKPGDGGTYLMASNEVTAADIARVAGVGRAAVSNWRRRHPDFPAPIGGSPNSPTFALPEVEAWLAANGRGVNRSGGAAARSREAPHALLAQVLAALLPAMPRGTVLDPACGDGAALAAAVTRLGSGLRYVGL